MDLATSQAKTYKVTIIDCVCNYYKMNGAEKENIDKFVNAITSGERPTISYNDIGPLFIGGYETTRKNGKPALDIRTEGPKNATVRTHNFKDRENLPFKRDYFCWKGESPKPKEKKEAPKNEIPFEYIFDNQINDGDTFEFNGTEYVYDYNNSVAYPVSYKKAGKTKIKFVNKLKPLPVINENTIRFTRDDLFEMVKKVLKNLL